MVFGSEVIQIFFVSSEVIQIFFVSSEVIQIFVVIEAIQVRLGMLGLIALVPEVCGK